MGMAFQSYPVWPHMTVANNVEFPLKVRGVPVREAQPSTRPRSSAASQDGELRAEEQVLEHEVPARASGEITREQFDKMRRVLERSA